jgi:hypothetical protein
VCRSHLLHAFAPKNIERPRNFSKFLTRFDFYRGLKRLNPPLPNHGQHSALHGVGRRRQVVSLCRKRSGTAKTCHCDRGRPIDEHVYKNSHVFIDHVNLRQVVCAERLWETRGSRLPLRGVIGLWIGVGSLWNLDGPRRSPTGRGRRAVSAGSPSSEADFSRREESCIDREQIEPLHCNREWQCLDCELQLLCLNGKQFGLHRPRLLRREKQCSHADAPQFPALPTKTHCLWGEWRSFPVANVRPHVP